MLNEFLIHPMHYYSSGHSMVWWLRTYECNLLGISGKSEPEPDFFGYPTFRVVYLLGSVRVATLKT